MNVVKEFHDKSNALGFQFHYGTDKAINLFNEGIDKDQTVVMLLSPVKYEDNLGDFGANDIKTANGRFFIGRDSLLEDTIYNENGYDPNDGKYTKNVVPLFADLDKLRDSLICSLTLKKWSYEDVYDEQDHNLDGLWVDFTFEYD